MIIGIMHLGFAQNIYYNKLQIIYYAVGSVYILDESCTLVLMTFPIANSKCKRPIYLNVQIYPILFCKPRPLPITAKYIFYFHIPIILVC